MKTAWPLLSLTAPSPVHQCLPEHMELVTLNSIGNKVRLLYDLYCIVPAVHIESYCILFWVDILKFVPAYW